MKKKKNMSKLYCWRCEGFSVGQPGSAFFCGVLAVVHLKFHFVAFSFVCQTWVRFSRRQSRSVPPGGTALTSIVLRTDLSKRAGPQPSQHLAVHCLPLSTALSPRMLFLKNKSPVFWWSVEGSKRSWNRLPNVSPNLEYYSHCRGRGVPRVRDFAAHTGRSPLYLLTWHSVLSISFSFAALQLLKCCPNGFLIYPRSLCMLIPFITNKILLSFSIFEGCTNKDSSSIMKSFASISINF